MKTFKEYKELKDLESFNERVFAKFGNRNFPVYINPTITDLSELVRSGARSIRGLTKDQYVFIWDSSNGYHSNISSYLGSIDQDLKDRPDICFYLEARGLNSAGPEQPLLFTLLYSSFTGKSTESGTYATHLQRLMQFPAMKKLIPYIDNIEEILNPDPRELQRQDSFYDHPHPSVLFDPTKFSHKDAIWQQKDVKPVNPYRWASGMHRVGD